MLRSYDDCLGLRIYPPLPSIDTHLARSGVTSAKIKGKMLIQKENDVYLEMKLLNLDII